MYEIFFEFSQVIHDYGLTLKAYFQRHHEWLAATIVSFFALVNSVRIIAYVPQIIRAAADTNGASAISYTTWGLFFVSHLTTIAYAIVVLGDLILAGIFFGNALACLAILGVTFFKRRRFAAKTMDVLPRQRRPAQVPVAVSASEFGRTTGYGALLAMLVGALLLVGAALI